MTKRFNNRRKPVKKLSFGQKAFLVLSVLIVLSMVVSLFATYLSNSVAGS